MRGQRHAPAALYPRQIPGTHCTEGWVGPRAGLDKCEKSRPLTGIRSPDHPARSQSLYRLRYPAHVFAAGRTKDHDQWGKRSPKDSVYIMCLGLYVPSVVHFRSINTVLLCCEVKYVSMILLMDTVALRSLALLENTEYWSHLVFINAFNVKLWKWSISTV